MFLTWLIRHLGYTCKCKMGRVKGMTTWDAHPTRERVEAGAQWPPTVQGGETLKCTDSRHRNPNQKLDTCLGGFVSL